MRQIVGLNPILPFASHRMRTTQQFSITLPNDMAELVRSRVAAGEYATESEVIRDGLRILAARDKAVEAWLREQVVPAAEALRDDPLRGIPIDQMRKHLTQRRARISQSKSQAGSFAEDSS